MKTLINKTNQQIRITAPEIIRWFTDFYVVKAEAGKTKGRVLVVKSKDWTLVEGEPEDIEKILELLEKHLELFTAGNLDRRKGYTKHDMQDAFILGFKAGIKRR